MEISRSDVIAASPMQGTLVQRLMSEHGDKFAFTVSHTTRKPRAGEQDGVAYMFVDRPVMEAAINAGSFLEHAEVHGNLYGTSVEAVQRCAAAGKSALLEIDVQVRHNNGWHCTKHQQRMFWFLSFSAITMARTAVPE